MVESNKMPIRYPDFAKRVKSAMTSRTLDVQDVVEAFKLRGVRITYEMVRRYTLGQAIPRQDKMQILAEALEVAPSWLQYGTSRSEATAVPPVKLRSKAEDDAAVLWKKYGFADEATRVTVDFLLSGRRPRPQWMSPAVAGLLAQAISLVAEQFPSPSAPRNRSTGTHGDR